jgi:hypothetical protein
VTLPDASGTPTGRLRLHAVPRSRKLAVTGARRPAVTARSNGTAARPNGPR